MLVFGRKLQQSIRINDNIRITIVSIRGESVRVGIEAPRDVIIHREEVWEKIREQKREKT